jgi:hypothetical protein
MTDRPKQPTYCRLELPWYKSKHVWLEITKKWSITVNWQNQVSVLLTLRIVERTSMVVTLLLHFGFTLHCLTQIKDSKVSYTTPFMTSLWCHKYGTISVRYVTLCSVLSEIVRAGAEPSTATYKRPHLFLTLHEVPRTRWWKRRVFHKTSWSWQQAARGRNTMTSLPQ